MRLRAKKTLPRVSISAPRELVVALGEKGEERSP